MLLTDAITNRAVGQYPLSIATSLALEAAQGIHPDIPAPRPPVLQYGNVWINLRTLFRNFMGALSKEGAQGAMPGQIAQALLEEMEFIQAHLANENRQEVNAVFYLSDYAGIETKYRLGVVRRDNTLRQKEYTALLNATLKRILEHTQHGALNVATYPLKLKTPVRHKALLLTHIPYDLFSAPAFDDMALLESHTGAIKRKAQWYTKYLHGKDLAMIPFREDFIQVFGDAVTFRPADPKLQKALIEIATQYRWTSVVTRDKIVYSIRQMPNPFFRDTLLSILV